jgi:hypothetical protein
LDDDGQPTNRIIDSLHDTVDAASALLPAELTSNLLLQSASCSIVPAPSAVCPAPAVQPLSSNFAFLAAHDQGLARLGALAEWAFHHDPPTTLGKLRLFAELLAKLLAARHAIEVLPRESFEAVLRVLRDRGVLPPAARRAVPLFAPGRQCRGAR